MTPNVEIAVRKQLDQDALHTRVGQQRRGVSGGVAEHHTGRWPIGQGANVLADALHGLGGGFGGPLFIALLTSQQFFFSQGQRFRQA